MCNSTQRFLILFLNAPKPIPNLEASIPSFLPLASYREKLLTLLSEKQQRGHLAQKDAHGGDKQRSKGLAQDGP